MRPYSELPGFEALYLEDSYVMRIHEGVSEVCFQVEAVLTENHPRWAPPKSGEHNAYLRVDLVFPKPRRVEWIEKTMKPTPDPNGEVDYGNIDVFTWQLDLYDLLGEWGHVRIESDQPIVSETPGTPGVGA